MVAAGQSPLSYDAYWNLLFSAATQHDHEHRSTRPARRTVNYLDLTSDEYNEFSCSSPLDDDFTCKPLRNHATNRDTASVLLVPAFL